LHAYSDVDQFIPTEAPVFFNNTNSQSGKCKHIIGDSNLYFWQAGYYHIYTNLYHQEACQFSLFLNGVVVTGSTIGSPTGASQNSTSLIIAVNPGDISTPVSTSISPTGFAAVFELKNHTSFVPVITLNGIGGSGSALPQVTATITLFLLKELP